MPSTPNEIFWFKTYLVFSLAGVFLGTWYAYIDKSILFKDEGHIMKVVMGGAGGWLISHFPFFVILAIWALFQL